jgi:hypothetical protein
VFASLHRPMINLHEIQQTHSICNILEQLVGVSKAFN